MDFIGRYFWWLLGGIVVVGLIGAAVISDSFDRASRNEEAQKAVNRTMDENARLRTTVANRPVVQATAAPSAVPQSSPVPAVAAPKAFADGTHIVGSDIEPGTYRLRVRSPACYWARLKGFSGEMGDLISNENESGPTIVTIKPSDKGFESKGCGNWTSDLSPITSSPDSPFGDGVYQVGTEVAAGTWKTESFEDCYWARLRGFTGGMGDLIANDNSRGIVTIAKSDRGFRSNGCGMWTKIK